MKEFGDGVGWYGERGRKVEASGVDVGGDERNEWSEIVCGEWILCVSDVLCVVDGRCVMNCVDDGFEISGWGFVVVVYGVGRGDVGE